MRQHDHSNPYDGEHLIVGELKFRNFVHYDHNWKHDTTQADMVLEGELRDPHLDQQWTTGPGWSC